MQQNDPTGLTAVSWLYSAAQVRELDRLTIAAGMEGFDLMGEAARAAFRQLLQRWPQCRSVTVLCGGGNNGGDGYVMAGLAQQRGWSVQVVAVTPPERLTGEAQQAYQWARQRQVAVQPWQAGLPLTGAVLVDALLGTGLTGSVRAPFDAAIAAINAAGKPVLAVDIPSGLDSDTGQPLGACVRADLTVTFIGVKRGLLTGAGPAVIGALRFERLSVAEAHYRQVGPAVRHLQADYGHAWLKPRERTAHKGRHGHVLVVGGDLGMGGAALMAAQAAARVGAGLVSVATRAEHVTAYLARCPELMAHGVQSASELEVLLRRASVLVLGPGLGQSEWSRQLWQRALSFQGACVLDADALNLLSAAEPAPSRRDSWVLTPHPGEAARLLECDMMALAADRFAAARALQRRFGGAVVLKGAGTLVCHGDRDDQLALCSAGNPGMASGGMGDVLSGVIGGLLAQGVPLAEAARIGVNLHARSADHAARQQGERGLLATDLLPWLQRLTNPASESAGSLQVGDRTP